MFKEVETVVSVAIRNDALSPEVVMRHDRMTLYSLQMSGEELQRAAFILPKNGRISVGFWMDNRNRKNETNKIRRKLEH